MYFYIKNAKTLLIYFKCFFSLVYITLDEDNSLTLDQDNSYIGEHFKFFALLFRSSNLKYKLQS